ncbi:MAG: methyltransferase domain-containing protein [SAR202 cluster bacterium]|jgi:SAM-dependent methyltransferase|nr:methyltransferase domain-containing protein [SAR202 cluster bacterium]MDP7104604.1 methyltransferase domain-containing protein [SAR202 cluster bacterium]MDP7226281.1 methyltransferase domain-containing protein [SAR202 cluster bacterium]MDP7415148.1 methyltransferase domain-containing protein [SAR202 cluster bacterium]MDP7533618.1 methyltransferase domain-containing protein [SAR202 cluster bacterium]|tara:strand:- start:3427 stop:4326 length:900 start_codon:yes stop_codon:yes gene_type:complete
MDLFDVVRREPISSAIPDGSKIPWNDPDFSRRMLREHLTQDHDAASRRSERIERHVAWIHDTALAGNPGRVLDLGCGPGFYSDRLTKLGHRCVGIDFSPASIEYAREHASTADLARGYTLADILTTEFGAGFNLAMVLFGELNAFARSDAANIVEKAFRAIAPGGKILLEVHTFGAVRAMGRNDPTWYSSEQGLFSDSAFICLMEHHWDENTRIATQRFLVIDPKDSQVTRHAQSIPAYTDDEYAEMLESAGFTDISFHATMGEDDEQPAATDDATAGDEGKQPTFVIVTANKPGRDES